MKDARRQSGNHADQKRRNHRNPYVASADNQHGSNRAAGCDAAVHRQICDVKNTEGDIDTNRHNSPDYALGHGAWKRVQQFGNLHGIVLLFSSYIREAKEAFYRFLGSCSLE